MALTPDIGHNSVPKPHVHQFLAHVNIHTKKEQVGFNGECALYLKVWIDQSLLVYESPHDRTCSLLRGYVRPSASTTQFVNGLLSPCAVVHSTRPDRPKTDNLARSTAVQDRSSSPPPSSSWLFRFRARKTQHQLLKILVRPSATVLCVEEKANSGLSGRHEDTSHVVATGKS